MNIYKVIKYNSKFFDQWNSFVEGSKNGTFLFHRNFMEYHQDRFEDFSLMVFKNDKLIALLPANIKDKVVYSHQGLSYGGLIFTINKLVFKEHLTVIASILSYLNKNQILEIYVKSMPSIYDSSLNEENELIFFWLQAKIHKCDIYSVIDVNDPLCIPNRNRKRGYNRAISNAIKVKESNRFDLFWNKILSNNLGNRFGVKPVHTISEIELLKKHFPKQIKLYLASNKEGLACAGALIFIFEETVHFQYSSGDDNRENGALDYLFIEIIKKFKQKKYISFGSSTDPSTNNISKGLLYWKESLGSRNIVQKYYKIDTSKHTLLENRII